MSSGQRHGRQARIPRGFGVSACLIAAARSFASAALAESATAAPQLVLPALAVKAGRQCGVSVLDKRRQAEQQEMAAAEAAAAKRTKIIKPTSSVATVVDPSLPAGVGTMGRGRSAVNARLTGDGSTVEALQRRRLSLLSKAEFRPMRSVVGVAPVGAGNTLTACLTVQAMLKGPRWGLPCTRSRISKLKNKA